MYRFRINGLVLIFLSLQWRTLIQSLQWFIFILDAGGKNRLSDC